MDPLFVLGALLVVACGIAGYLYHTSRPRK
jgi:hypothetical protein